MIGFGPLVSPMISGCASPTVGWRWSFWIALIIAGTSSIGLVFLPETYGPKLLTDRARRLRRDGTEPFIFGPLEIARRGWRDLLKCDSLLPLRMLFSEPIVAAVCLYLAVLYGIFYMYFGAYPIIFQGIYGMTPCASAAMFFPIGMGDLSAVALGAIYDSFLVRARATNHSWSQSEEAFRLPLACLGGPLASGSMFWLGWAAQKDIHWAVPFASGFVNGLGTQLIFIGLLNYIADAYVVYAASAFAASSCSRSVFGASLPLVVSKMYDSLDVAWATSTLGFASLIMAIVPFALIRYGPILRERSKLCMRLQEQRRSGF